MIMEGKEMIAKAKMRGMTPLPEIFMGMTEDWPPYILVPRTCFAYCTGILRSARSTKTMQKNTTTASTRKPMTSKRGATLFAVMEVSLSRMESPAVEMIPTKMMSEMPLPTPYSVMRSPSHMTSMAPAV